MSLIDEGFWDLEYQTLKPRYNIASAATLYEEESYTDRYGGIFVSSFSMCSHTIEKGDFLMQRNNVYSRSYQAGAGGPDDRHDSYKSTECFRRLRSITFRWTLFPYS